MRKQSFPKISVGNSGEGQETHENHRKERSIVTSKLPIGISRSMSDWIQDVLYGLLTKVLSGIKVNSDSTIHIHIPKATISVIDNTQIMDKSRDNKMLNNLNVVFEVEAGPIDWSLPLKVMGNIDEKK